MKPTPERTSNSLTALIGLLRPLQALKNIFVLAGVFFAGRALEPQFGLKALAAFLVFTLVSGAVYVFNDLMDRDADRVHPRKRFRPLASGRVSVGAASWLGALSIAGAIVLALLTDMRLLVVVLIYAAINLAYSLGLKHVVLLDVFCIASGFLLRLLAGTWGLGIPPSQWFVLCTFLLSLFLAFSKRYAERIDESQHSTHKRAVIEDYPPEFLRMVLAATLACTLMAYGLYTMSPATLAVHGTGALIYTLPLAAFVMFRYLWLVMKQGYGEDPSGELVKDTMLLVGVALYTAVTGALLFGAS